jgi:hypothetical protein
VLEFNLLTLEIEMGLFGFFGFFGIFEIIGFALFCLFMVVGCSFDRRGELESIKWWVFLAGLAALTVLTKGTWSFVQAEPGKISLWETVQTFAFWKPVIFYLLIGLGYSILEFFLTVRRSARYYKEKWSEFLNTTYKERHGPKSTWDTKRNSELLKRSRELQQAGLHPRGEVSKSNLRVAADGTLQDDPEQSARNQEILDNAARDSETLANGKLAVKWFTSQHNEKQKMIYLKQSEDELDVSPVIGKVQLAENLAVWTLFWPFYLISLILGDLLTEIFTIIADFVVHLSGRFVKLSFKDVFNLS